MFYKQSIDDIKLIILTLDGGLLDLNHLRYNYFKNICKQYNKTISKENFNESFGNHNTMYENSPIQDKISNNDLNKKIEKDLFAYCKIKQNIKKQGVDELLQFCHQKKIKIAVITTHKCKRAIQYLQLTGIYKDIDFLIGGDSNVDPLPCSDILKTICSQMNVSYNNTLIVANFPSLVQAATSLYINMIYLNDLVEANDIINESVYRTVNNNLEVINVLLFSKYDDLELFSKPLGMSKDMSYNELTETYKELLNKYKDDKQLITLINNTYQYYCHNLIYDKESDIVKPNFNEESKTLEELSTNNIDLFSNSISTNSSTSAINIDVERMNELMDIINNNSEDNIDNDEELEEIKESNPLNHFINFICNLLLSFLIVLVFMVLNLVIDDYMANESTIFNIIHTLVNYYFNIIENIYNFIIKFINLNIQYDVIYQIIIASIFNILIIYILKLIIYLIKKLTKRES